MSASPRTARMSRALAISAAAVVVAVTAAACASASASTGPSDGYGAGPVEEHTHTPGAAAHVHSPEIVPASKSKKDEPKEKEEGEKEKKKGEDAAKKLDILGTNCDDSKLERHDGFQKSPRCVETSMGELAAVDKSPSLLITDAPRKVKAGEDFAIIVSTRNLKRDRFLGAAAGGYYAESSFLDEEGIQRGHFHTACRMLETTKAAPDGSLDPAFFFATQDNQGGAGETKATVDVTGGLPDKGIAQCSVWAGDGSHRTPMMERANQTPAFDVVRIIVG